MKPWISVLDPTLRATLAARLSNPRVIDPGAAESAPWIAALEALDARFHTHPLGRDRPAWVFYDALLAPGIVVGDAHPTGAGTDSPSSMIGLIPTGDPRAWLVQTIAAPGEVALASLLALTRRLDVADRLVVSLTWKAYRDHPIARWPLTLEAAVLPSLDEPETFTAVLDLAAEPLGAPASLPTPHPSNTQLTTPPLGVPASLPTPQALQAALSRGVRVILHAGHATLTPPPPEPSPRPLRPAVALVTSVSLPRPPFSTANDAIFDQLAPFLVAAESQRLRADLTPLGLPTRWLIDPQHPESAPFLLLLQQLDRLTFGPGGMPMERWVFHDTAERPGLIYGFAFSSETLGESERALWLVPPGYRGPVPCSMYIAIPTAAHARDTWFGHNLASLNRAFPDRGLAHLGTLTKAFALRAFGVNRLLGATQWSSPALKVHTKFGPLDLVTSWTPAHSLPASLTYAVDLSDQALLAAVGAPHTRVTFPEVTRWIAPADEPALQALQEQLEEGQRWVVSGAPTRRAESESNYVPISLISGRK